MAFVEIFLSAFITVLFEKLAKLASGDLLSFARRQGIHSLVERWSGALAQIQAVVDDAEEKQIEDGAVGLWMEHLRDLAYDLDDILDDFAYEALRRKLNTPAQHHHQASTSRSSKENSNRQGNLDQRKSEKALIAGVFGRGYDYATFLEISSIYGEQAIVCYSAISYLQRLTNRDVFERGSCIPFQLWPII